MEAFQKLTNGVKGIEILHFDDCELSKMKNGSTSFTALGPLSLVMFKDYHRFVLQLNDWKFPLLRRLPITATAAGDLGDSITRTYILPAMNGFTYHLKINAKPTQSNALNNLETVFSNNSHFLLAGHEGKKLEASPDDKLVRPTKGTAFTGPSTMEKISDSTKSIVKKVTTSLKGSGKFLTASKKKSTPKEHITKDYRGTAKSTFKKDYFKASEKLSEEFAKLRKENPNMSDVKEFNSLRGSSGPSVYMLKDELEGAIWTAKDVFTQGKYDTVEEIKKKGLLGSIKEAVMGKPREVQKPVETESKVVGIEHYQG